MRLTSVQRRTLELYRKFHAVPPTPGRLFATSFVRHVIISLLFFVPAAMAYFITQDLFLAGLALGMGLGVIVRDVSHFRVTIQVWPVVSYVLNWKKIDECLEMDAYTAEYPEEL